MKNEDNGHEEEARRDMVEQVARHFSDTSHSTGVSVMREALRTALSRVPRHHFVPSSSVHLAYADTALPIGYGQTISQPFIVALMIELALRGGEARVLEVGTGSGYGSAVLSQVVDEVFSIERVSELAEASAARLAELGFDRVRVRCGDGFDGWEESAPFDAILVTACSQEIPKPLLDQLAIGGRMVIPIGSPNAYQELRVIEKTSDEEYVVRHGLPVAFVPLVHCEESGNANGGSA